jgi:adenosylhomocysteine nucleosidase
VYDLVMAIPYPDPLVVMALEVESAGLFAQYQIPVLYTGVGKVNAAHRLTRRLEDYHREGRPLPLVVNFGTAGGVTAGLASLVECTAFIQRDMLATALGCAPYVTPFDADPQRLEAPSLLNRLPTVVCGTGDSFVTEPCGGSIDVVDMEAYALAKVCWQYGARFACFKYISDSSDAEAAESWRTRASHAAEAFISLHSEIVRLRA